MRDNPIQFAVVREDPTLEIEVLQQYPCRDLLLIASGGCTALALRSQFPTCNMTLLDPNPAQLDLVNRKQAALAQGQPSKSLFNIECDDPHGLSECGNFESLFRGFRGFVYDMILSRSLFREMFESSEARPQHLQALLSSPYWPVAFAMHFCDPLLVTMFGPDAVQHAPPGSFPKYFQQRLEQGLLREDMTDNPFLHHIFLGHYLDRPGCLPRFLQQPVSVNPFKSRNDSILNMPNFQQFDFINLSNILDWMPSAEVQKLMSRLLKEARPKTVVMWRQLNNNRDLYQLLQKRFSFSLDWNQQLHLRDQSLFYTSVHVGICRS